MKVVALVSGGKDSCYAMMKCIEYGHQIVALANLLPADDNVDELDSYMYQTVGHQIIVSYAECMGLPLFRRRIRGSTRNEKLNYKRTAGDEVEDMFILLNEVKKQIPSVSAVSSGAIASDYQRLRVESVCSRLGLISLAYLWKQDQSLLLHEMITKGILAVTVKVAAMGLDPAKHLGKELEVLEPYLHKLKDLYGINVCGEGGEYETLTLDCPLFINARIVLDEFEVVLHSSDSIAPVGVIHPLRFHLEKKDSDSISVKDKDNTQKVGFVFEVQEESSSDCGIVCESPSEITDMVEVSDGRLHISTKEKDDAFSICCWLKESSESSTGLQEDLKLVLGQIEVQLLEYGLGWEHVLYVHLYISDMKDFVVANETYVRFITQDGCPFGVPSRSTIELPLQKAGLGKAYVEVLVAKDQSKKVLHVQSISCWAPSCIGPYSQATLHKNILHMAGQLGLDPPRMVLHNEGPAAELEQALKNSESVAKCFNCSISNSAILFVVYCSVCIPQNERGRIDEMLNCFLDQNRPSCTEKTSKAVLLDPICIYALVPDLPKSALVEIKPILYVPESMETTEETTDNFSGIAQSISWGFEPADWHDSCIQKCVVKGKFGAAVMCITSTIAAKVCSESVNEDLSNGDDPHSISEGEMKIISRFCLYILDKVISGNNFSWEDALVLRIHFRTDLQFALETLSNLFKSAFMELAEMNQQPGIDTKPFFNLVPVMASGPSASSMDAIITCELFAQKC